MVTVRVQGPKKGNRRPTHLDSLGGADGDDASIVVCDAFVDAETVQEVGARIEEVDFERCHLTSASLIFPVGVRVVRFTDCTASSIAVAGGDVVNVVRSRFEDCKLSGQCFSQGILLNARFRHCLMSGSRFRFARLRNCLFDSCDLTSCDFDGATLHHVAFGGSRLGATFNNVSVKGMVDLRGAELESVRPVLGLRGFTADVEQAIGLAIPLAKAAGILLTETDS